jgi:hypothetical protein
LLESRQGLGSGEPLRIKLLDAFDLETKALEQERAGELVVAGSGIRDLDGDDDWIAGPVHVLVRLELQSRSELSLRGIVLTVAASEE